jgi:hypothetical protein
MGIETKEEKEGSAKQKSFFFSQYLLVRDKFLF